eukprot:UN32270
MAHEIIGRKPRGGAVMKASDMHALGVITYILMSGKPPFFGSTDEKIYRRIRDNKWSYPKSSVVKWSDNLMEFVSKCLKYKPLERLSAAKALKHDWIIDEKIGGQENFDKSVLASLEGLTKDTKLQK